jgi:hypothetical protein
MAPRAPAGDRRTGAATGGRRVAPLWIRLLLAAASVMLTALVLEGATRLLVPPPAPVWLRGGVYVSQLPLVTGRDTVERVEGRPLPEEKRPGEIRVFVFGESSVAGNPWGYAGSPATMLHDQLVATWPGRDVTIVNMGRSAGTTMDSYYFLASIARFSPDFIVFYQGGNDFFNIDRERCMPARHPWLHAMYRGLVERSRFLWTARAIGPSLLAERLPPRGEKAGRGDVAGFCDPREGFQAWTDVLVTTAKRTGAQVFVTTSVQNPLSAHEDPVPWGVERATGLAGRSESYRRILACLLEDGCDVVEALRREQADEQTHGAWVRSRGEAWQRSAAEAGVPAVDFAAYLDQHAAGGLRPALFVEDMHLSLEGYWWLSWLWARQLDAMIGGGSFDATTAGLPPAFPAARYLDAVAGGSPAVMACTLLHAADAYVRRNRLLVAATLLRSAVALDVDAPGGVAASQAGRAAQLFLGAMRRDLGMDPALPPAQRDDLGSRSLDDLGRLLRDQPSCTSAGPPAEPTRPAGPAELALLAPLATGATLGGYRVSEIDAVRGGVITAAVARDDSRIELLVALAGPRGPPPPAVAGRYAIFYVTRGSSEADASRLAAALAAVIEKNVAAPTPPGMTGMLEPSAQGPAPARNATPPPERAPSVSRSLAPDTAAQITASVWPMRVGGAAIALACLLLLRRFVSGVTTFARDPRGQAWPAAFVLAGLLLRLTVTPTSAMNNAPVAPRSFLSLDPGVTTVLVWADRLGLHVSPFSLLVAAVWIAGLGCVWHAYFLAVELGAPRPVASLTALGFALWPAFVRWSTTDSPHVLALLFWFVAARIWVAPSGGDRSFHRARSLSGCCSPCPSRPSTRSPGRSP